MYQVSLIFMGYRLGSLTSIVYHDISFLVSSPFYELEGHILGWDIAVVNKDLPQILDSATSWLEDVTNAVLNDIFQNMACGEIIISFTRLTLP